MIIVSSRKGSRTATRPAQESAAGGGTVRANPNGIRGLARLLVWLPAALAAAGSVAAQPVARLSPPEVAERTLGSIVRIEAVPERGPAELGTGFLVGPGGELVTNLHVIGRATQLRVHLPDGQVVTDVHFLAADAEHDLVLLSVGARDLPYLRLSDSPRPRVGEALYVLGHPLGMDITFSDGIVSGHPELEGIHFIQITAPISRGSSGGPVVDARAEVIGVAAAFARGGQNVNLALPASMVRALLEQETEPRAFAAYARRLRSLASDARYVAAALPESTRQPAPETSRESQRRLLDELATTVRRLGGRSYEPDGGVRIGHLSHGQRGGLELSLPPGRYRIVGVCDRACHDLDFYLQLDDREVARDVGADAVPIVELEVRRPASYRLVTYMMGCTVDPCTFAVQVFRRSDTPPPAESDAAAPADRVPAAARRDR
jgi:S1-C subfamily serine protease